MFKTGALVTEVDDYVHCFDSPLFGPLVEKTGIVQWTVETDWYFTPTVAVKMDDTGSEIHFDGEEPEDSHDG